MTKTFINLISILFLSNCNSVDFNNPFPSDQKPLDKIGPEFIGKYYYADSIVGKKGDEQFFNSKYFSSTMKNRDSITLFSSDLTVTDKLVCYSIEFTFFYILDKVDTSRLNKGFKYKNVFVKDKYFIHTEKYSDTLLDLNGKDKLFLYKNHYYLNHYKKGNSEPAQEKSWRICQFEKIDITQYSLNMTNEQDYKLLFDTTKTWQPIFPIAHISNKQFKNFIDKGGFHEKYRLIKYAH